ncbi:hypothetical protein Glove_124g19 [Diversispora epigaea]|uniref:Uncharacterized protein n=1 Tax=Diversispora epigaea TaxID=1348612 RepID=A0A397J121_9GLOM|nr:hypothetical protein Glove_124g19 [Diversispora epigaea]
MLELSDRYGHIHFETSSSASRFYHEYKNIIMEGMEIKVKALSYWKVVYSEISQDTRHHRKRNSLAKKKKTT